MHKNGCMYHYVFMCRVKQAISKKEEALGVLRAQHEVRLELHYSDCTKLCAGMSISSRLTSEVWPHAST